MIRTQPTGRAAMDKLGQAQPHTRPPDPECESILKTQRSSERDPDTRGLPLIPKAGQPALSCAERRQSNMTDTPAEVEAARALVAAYDALNSPEHEKEAESLRELSLRVSSRVDAFHAAQERIHGLHAAACASGTPAADNTEAAHVINGDDDTEIEDLTHLFADADDDDDDEFQTPRANGAYTDA